MTISDEELAKLCAALDGDDSYFEVDGNMGYEFTDVDSTVTMLIARIIAAESKLARAEAALREAEKVLSIAPGRMTREGVTDLIRKVLTHTETPEAEDA